MKDLLRKEMTKEALAHFEECIRRDAHFVPAWEAMAVAYRQMGQEKEARRCEEMAKYIRQHLWQKEMTNSE